MTVAELIEKLKVLPQDALVLHRGYEDGYDPANNNGPLVDQVVSMKHPEWYNGRYELLRMLSDPDDIMRERYNLANPITAVII